MPLALDQVDLVQGRPIVMKSHKISYEPGTTVVRTTVHSEVKQIAFNKKLGMETFRPGVAPEAEVVDTTTGRV